MSRWGGIKRRVTWPGESKLTGLSLRAAKGAPKRSAKPVKRRRVAVLITHGMGQQLPFETLDSLVEGLIATAQQQSRTQIPEVRAVTARLGELTTQRVEFDTKTREGEEVEVHVYEGYWAPLTEGQVSLGDVMAFLFGAAGNGLRNSFGTFKRWMFGQEVGFGRQHWARLSLLLAASLLLSLVVLNAAIATFSVDSALGGDIGSHFGSGSYLVTFVAGCFGAISIATGAVLYLLSKLNRFGETRLITLLIRLPVLGLFLLLILAWGILALFWWGVYCPWIAGLLGHWSFVAPLAHRCWWVIWGLLALGSWVVKLFLVEYVGDVAAYVSSHSLDRFNDLRLRIKATVFTIAKAIYAQKDQPYDGVILAGHSLGSVITYDTLNALINDDALSGRPLNILGRTRLLLTFGSPLDKTAYIFANQWANTTDTREALAASLQPLILDYAQFRGIDWVNVYSCFDIVSNCLKFYDDEHDALYDERRVQNRPDRWAITPLLAHIEYWRNTEIFLHIYEHL